MSTPVKPEPRIVGKVYLGTDFSNDEPARTFDERRHRCYELAAYALAFADAPHNAMLVHGSIYNREHSKIGRISHAWLTLPGGRAWEPITGLLYTTRGWDAWSSPMPEHVYTRKQTQRMISVFMTYGPWEEMKYR